MATGFARGAHARGKRIAFGDGNSIIWGPWSEEIFRNNPNIAQHGNERGIEWVKFYKGNRVYNSQDRTNERWVWNLEWRATPGEFFFDKAELAFAKATGGGFIVIEPNVPKGKSVAPNKQWPRERYAELAKRLKGDGARVVQVCGPNSIPLDGVERIETPSFRHAAAALSRAALYVGPEGGLHHAAAAVGTRGVVIFGGFIPPSVTGYSIHTNLTGGAIACGKYNPCEHCRAAMDAITVAEVYAAAHWHLRAAA